MLLFLAAGVGVHIDLAQAVVYYKRAAGQGLACAQYSLAMCNVEGRGTYKCNKHAVDLLRQAAKQGFSEAQYILAKWHSTGMIARKDLPKAAVLFKAAEDQGRANA